jgi:pimeloyl-ACP methyl ester carboxylesterase
MTQSPRRSPPAEPGGNNVERIDIMSKPVNDDAIDFFEIDQDITLRRMVLRNSNPKGTVLFLHGFPETLYVWKDIAKALADEYEIHAFDWPGYGLSSRPTLDRFSYAPKDYARILDRYFGKAGIDTSKLTIYATDIGALPTLLLAVERPDIARTIIVGDFAPFNRPQFMYASLQSLKEGPAMDQVRANLNSNRDEILQNTFTRGLPEEEHFEVAREFKDDMFRGWTLGAMTSADAFSHYYSHFTRDQDHFEIATCPAQDAREGCLGRERHLHQQGDGSRVRRTSARETDSSPGIGHFPHLQNPMLATDEVRDAFR